MTVHSFWQQSGNNYPASVTRQLARLLLPTGDGVRDDVGAPLLVRAQATLDMSVRVNAGWARRGTYLGFNDALTTVALDAANSSNPRIDLIVLRWRDTESGDGESSAKLEFVKGTPAASPSAPSTVGMTVQVLAKVLVAAGTTTIAGAAITDQRTFANRPIGAAVSLVDSWTADGSTRTHTSGYSLVKDNGGFWQGNTTSPLVVPAGYGGLYRVSWLGGINAAATASSFTQVNGLPLLMRAMLPGGSNSQNQPAYTEIDLDDGAALSLTSQYVIGSSSSRTLTGRLSLYRVAA